MPFDNENKLAVWNKSSIVEGFDPVKYRKDPCGAWIIFDEYKNTDNIYGWEIDHIYPKSLLEKKGFAPEIIGDIKNLRAMQWENNRAKDNDYPTYQSVVSSENNKNIHIEKSLTVNAKIQKTLEKLYKL